MRPAQRRERVDAMRATWQVGIGRACTVLTAVRSSDRYTSRRPSQGLLKKRIRANAETGVRYGYRRIHVLLRRERWAVNARRVVRLYTEAGLQLRHKTPKPKVSAKLREDRCAASAPNGVWAMDFMSDRSVEGRSLRILTNVDTFSRLSAAIDVRHRYRGSDVVETLERATGNCGEPETIRADHGPEFARKALDL